MPSLQLIMFALLGGVLPAIFWLIFWLREDRAHPEPKKIIIEAFMAGMSCVILVYPIQYIVQNFIFNGSDTSLSVWITWAAAEELIKFAACYFVALRRKDDDQPIDAVLYMIIVAIGFSALENTLYILDPLTVSTVSSAYALGASRFIGASLLHILSSAIVGIFFAFSFYKHDIHKKINVTIGLFFAVLVHTLFNLSMLDQANKASTGASGGNGTLILFAIVWLGIMGVIVIMEKIKTLEINDTMIQ